MSVARTKERRKTLREVAAAYPDLAAHGFDVRYRTQVRPAFQELRRRLLEEEERFASARQWIQRRLRPIQSFNERRTSYGLKHICEAEIGYLTNGTFVAAMIACGYRVRRDGANAVFNVGERSVKEAAAAATEKVGHGVC